MARVSGDADASGEERGRGFRSTVTSEGAVRALTITRVPGRRGVDSPALIAARLDREPQIRRTGSAESE